MKMAKSWFILKIEQKAGFRLRALCLQSVTSHFNVNKCYKSIPLKCRILTLPTHTVVNSLSWNNLTFLNSSRRLSFFTALDHASRDANTDDSLILKEEWLGKLLEKSPMDVSTENFLVVLRALSDSKLPDAAIRSERWLHRLELHAGVVNVDFKSNGSPAIPNAECYQRVIETWSQTESEDPSRVVTRAERWLWKHINSPSPLLRPNTACFNAFLDACTKGRSFRGSKNTSLQRQHAEKAETTLRFMIKMTQQEGPQCRTAPDIESFNYVLRGWTRDRRNPEIAERASSIFTLLEDYGKTTDSKVLPNSKTYHMLMDSIAVRARQKVKRCLTDRSARYNQQYNGLHEIKLLKSMLQILHRLQNEGDGQLGPSTFAYNMLLSCWANIAPLHRSAPNEAETILRHMTSLQDRGQSDVGPDSTSYLLVMRAWVASDCSISGERVEWLLSKQWQDYDFSGDEKLRPSSTSYDLVMKAWASRKNPQRVEKVLTELIALSERTTSKPIRPTSESFSFVIRAWLSIANEGSEQALQKALWWFNVLVEREKTDQTVVTSTELYGAIFGAARTCALNAPEVLDLAITVFKNLLASHHAVEPIHFSRLLQIGLLALSKPEKIQLRVSFVKQIVMDCKEAGLVSKPFVTALLNGPVSLDGSTMDASQKMVGELFPNWPLPPSWTRNVHPEGFLLSEADFVCQSNKYNTTQRKPLKKTTGR